MCQTISGLCRSAGSSAIDHQMPYIMNSDFE